MLKPLKSGGMRGCSGDGWCTRVRKESGRFVAKFGQKGVSVSYILKLNNTEGHRELKHTLATYRLS